MRVRRHQTVTVGGDWGRSGGRYAQNRSKGWGIGSQRGEPLGGTGGGAAVAPPQNRSKGWGIASQRGEPLGGTGGGAAVAPPQNLFGILADHARFRGLCGGGGGAARR